VPWDVTGVREQTATGGFVVAASFKTVALDVTGMGLAITHFALGAGMMQLLLEFVAPDHRYRQSVVVASGLWALIPDLHYVSPVLQGPLSQLKFSVLGNVFWFHHALDSLHAGRGTRGIAAVMLTFLLVVTVSVNYVDVRRSSEGSEPS
jgi:hypothetical protein